jgi:hypothetical protein
MPPRAASRQLNAPTFDATDERRVTLVLVYLVVTIIALIALVWIGRIFYALRKGLNEIIIGLTSIDERLARIEARSGQPV